MEKNTVYTLESRNPENYRTVLWLNLKETLTRQAVAPFAHGLAGEIDTYPTIEYLEADLQSQKLWQDFADKKTI